MKIAGETNVLSGRYGSGLVAGVGREFGRFVVTTMELPWQVTKDRLGGTPEAVIMVESMEQTVIDRQLAEAPPCDTIVAIGGGQAIDLGKYFAWRRNCRLVSIPTIVSVDAFVTPKAAVRHQHRVEYVGHASPDPLIIDYDLIRTAPDDLNIAGVGDLLSIHTATRDWEIAAQAGRSEYPFSADDIERARAILNLVRENAGEIRRVTDAGLQAIVDGYLLINTVCLPAGHYRTEEGSEHFLFYELEERLGIPFIHGQIVGLGIYVMSRWQQNQHREITALMDELGLKYQPRDMMIARDPFVAALNNLPAFVEARKLWYSVIQDRPVTPAWIDEISGTLQFA